MRTFDGRVFAVRQMRWPARHKPARERHQGTCSGATLRNCPGANFCTTTLVLRQLVLQTHWDTQGASLTFEARAGSPLEGTTLPQGTASASYPARTAHQRLKAMKHDLTLDQMKKEARDLLRGLERRDPEALRRCQAIDPLTELSNPALDHARHIIAREHGFSSWRKLKEHIENPRPF
jgi:hypothetical protein